KIKHLIIGEILGGLATTAHQIENYPSEDGISGIELMMKMQTRVENFGTKIEMDKVLNIEKKDKIFHLKTQNNKEYTTKTVLLATGTKHRKLGLKNEADFVGRGVSYCATCDAMFYKDKIVAVLGGSDSANTASLYLADIAQKVYQIYRKDALRGEVAWIDQIKNNNKIEVIYNTNIIEIKGDEKIKTIKLDTSYQGKDELEIDGLFIEIGSEPDYELLVKLNIKTNDHGYIVIEKDQSTNIDGIYAAGDITTGSNNFRQIITACSEGAIAAESIHKHIKLKT
ncbi:FAD-dependent oxidoreductase, partial [bacterium]|nr:FAD-dependent oxidoreductase [bacterium]